MATADERRVLAATAVLVVALAGLTALVSNPLWLVAAAVVPLIWFVVPRPLDALLYLLLFVTLTDASRVLGESIGLPSLEKALVVLVALAIGLRWLAGSALPRLEPAMVAVLGLFWLVAVASALGASDVAGATETLLDLAKNIALALVVMLLIGDERSFRGAVWTIVFAGGSVASIAAYQGLSGDFDFNPLGFGKVGYDLIVGETDSYRVMGPFDDPNFFGQSLLFATALAAYLVMAERELLGRALAASALLLCVLALLFTYSRGALIGLAAMLIVFLLARRRRPAVWVGLAAGLLLIAVAAPPRYFDRLGSLGTLDDLFDGGAPISDPAVEGRSAELVVAVAMFRDHPWLGVGIGNYEANFQHYNLRAGEFLRNEDREAHNYYLEIAAERGVGGMASLLLLLAVVASRVTGSIAELRSAGRRADAGLAGAVAIGLVGVATAALFLHDDYDRFLWLFIALACALPKLTGSGAAHADRDAASQAWAEGRGT